MLTPRQLVIVRLRVNGKHSCREIGALTRTHHSVIGRILARARKQLVRLGVMGPLEGWDDMALLIDGLDKGRAK